MAPRPAAIARLQKDPLAHKYDHGHALILSGPAGQTGAARLAARGALRVGAGLVTIGAPPAAMAEHAAQLNAIMLREIADARALDRALSDPRITALCLGPALGLDARAGALVESAVSSARRGSAPRPAVVLDADALTLLSRRTDLLAGLNAQCVLTSHAGEFSRLFPELHAEFARDAGKDAGETRQRVVLLASQTCGAVVLLKGPETVIAHPDGRVLVNAATGKQAAPWLATAGSGDVLAGFITGLLARGFDTMQAAELAAWLHVECALSFGPGLIAEDLPDTVPKILAAHLTPPRA